MDLILQILLGLVAVGIAGYPLAREQWFDIDEEEEISPETEDLFRRKESAYAALKELEFDYRTGKLSDVDYRELEAKYKEEAFEVLEVLEELDKKSTENPPKHPSVADRRDEDDDHREAKPRRGIGNGKHEQIEVLALCPECGYESSPGAQFCSSCGAPARPARTSPQEDDSDEVELCPQCSLPVRADQRFCSDCGELIHA